MAELKEKTPAIIIANNILFREGLARILSSNNYEVIVSASPDDADLPSTLKPQDQKPLILCACQEADKTVGLVTMFKELYRDGCVVVIAMQEDSLEMLAVLRAGARAFLTHDATSDSLLKAIEMVMLGGTVIPYALLPHLLNEEESPRDDTAMETSVSGSPIKGNSATETRQFDKGPSGDVPRLSTQEKRILSCLIIGDSNKVIGRKIGISEQTVKVNLRTIFRKLRLKNRTQAAIWGANEGSYVLNSGAYAPPPLPTNDTGTELPMHDQCTAPSTGR